MIAGAPMVLSRLVATVRRTTKSRSDIIAAVVAVVGWLRVCKTEVVFVIKGPGRMGHGDT